MDIEKYSWGFSQVYSFAKLARSIFNKLTQLTIVHILCQLRGNLNPLA